MVVRYPGPISRHNLVSPLLLRWYLVPVWDRFVLPQRWPFCHDGGRDAFGRHGATRELAQLGVSRSGRESVMAMGEFCRNVVGPPEWECEAMDSMVWVKCAISVECINISIGALTDKGPVRK